METKMKATLILSTLVTALSVISTASFAQNYVTYSSAFGNSHPTIRVATPATSRFTASDYAQHSTQQPQRLHTPGR
jgi:hypothetical protein